MISTGARVVVRLSAAALLAVAGHAMATPLLGSGFAGDQGAVLYDLDPLTGQAGNPRPTGISNLVGIACSPAADLYGLTNSVAANHPGSLFRIDRATGAAQFVGTTGLSGITEGDLAFDPTTSSLYGIWNLDEGRRQLFTLDTDTGAATALPGSLIGDPSGMAFDSSSTLYVLDTSLQKLLTVEKTSGAVVDSTDLSVPLGSTAGMDVDPATGVFYVADGLSGGTDRLYTLDTTTGVLTEVGPLGVDTGLAGLAFVPEPATMLLFAFAGAISVARRRSASL